MSRPRAADDFPVIRARLVELRCERERAWQRPDAPVTDASRRRQIPISRVAQPSEAPRSLGSFRVGDVAKKGPWPAATD
jgi:hypothetical protein